MVRQIKGEVKRGDAERACSSHFKFVNSGMVDGGESYMLLHSFPNSILCLFFTTNATLRCAKRAALIPALQSQWGGALHNNNKMERYI